MTDPDIWRSARILSKRYGSEAVFITSKRGSGFNREVVFDHGRGDTCACSGRKPKGPCGSPREAYQLPFHQGRFPDELELVFSCIRMWVVLVFVRGRAIETVGQHAYSSVIHFLSLAFLGVAVRC